MKQVAYADVYSAGMRSAVLAPFFSLVALAAPTMVEAPGFTFPLPRGYVDITAKLGKPNFVAVEAQRQSRGYTPTIAFQKVPIAGGSMGPPPSGSPDPTICANTGKSLAAGGKLKSANIVAGPLGKTCQIHFVAKEGVALITELNVVQTMGGIPVPQDTWLMTCNHADGDAAAEAVCRATLSKVRFGP